MAWGRTPTCVCGTCRACKHRATARRRYQRMTIEERRAWRARRDAERVRAADRKRYHEKIKDDPEATKRRRAAFAVNNAIRDGRMARQPCEACGAEPAQGHHDDYDKPLAVRWLCTICHAAEHNAPWKQAA